MPIDQLFVFAHLQGRVRPGRSPHSDARRPRGRGVDDRVGLRYLGRPHNFELDPVSLSLDDREAARGVGGPPKSPRALAPWIFVLPLRTAVAPERRRCRTWAT